MMQRGVKAKETLNKFYNTIFRTVKYFNKAKRLGELKVRGLVVSDCTVIFIDNARSSQDRIRDLRSILRVIQRVNESLITPNDGPSIMTTCSVDYGDFEYQNRIEFRGIEKDYFYGRPYINAFLDNEKLKNKPCYCRVLKKNLEIPDDSRATPPLSLLKAEDDYNYFYWMLSNLDDLERFERRYKDIRQSVYPKLISLMQSHIDRV